MYTQGFEHLPDWLEGRLREDVVGVFGLVDEDRNHDRAERLASGFADHSADRLNDVERMLRVSSGRWPKPSATWLVGRQVEMARYNFKWLVDVSVDDR